jgi:hypothetical protein
LFDETSARLQRQQLKPIFEARTRIKDLLVKAMATHILWNVRRLFRHEKRSSHVITFIDLIFFAVRFTAGLKTA